MSLRKDKPFIEVFVEEHCASCDAVARSLQPFAEEDLISIKVYQRGKYKSLLEKRSITIFPATYVNGRAAFSGVFTRPEFRYFLFRHQEIVDD